jgi:hypothetical protein
MLLSKYALLPAMAALSVLGGCVSTGARALDDRTAIISGSGNAFASPAQVQQHVLIAAAKSTLAKGFTKFVILGSQDTSSTSSYTAPGTSQTNGSFQAQPAYGGVAGSYSQNTTYNPGQTYNYFKPGMDVTIRMFGEADAPANAWSANAIIAAQPTKKQRTR